MELYISSPKRIVSFTRRGTLGLALAIALAAAAPAIGQCCDPNPHEPPPPPSRGWTWEIEDVYEGGDDGRIAVVVNDYLYILFESRETNPIMTYKDDLLPDHDVVVARFRGDGSNKSAEALRGKLQELWAPPDPLTGVVLVGILPYILYEDSIDEGPVDTFFMDMDGNWYDDDRNGLYDRWDDSAHQIEIWVSRVKADNLPLIREDPEDPETRIPEEEIIAAYFARNTLLRSDPFPVVDLALAYNYECAEAAEFLGNAFTVVHQECSEPNPTDYIARLSSPNDYCYIHEHSHGSGTAHAAGEGLVHNTDYLNANSNVIGFSLMSCYTCDFAYENYLGGCAAFNPFADTLIVFGYTMEAFGGINQEVLWSEVGAGRCFGESYKAMFNSGVASFEVALLGDGSLKADSHRWDGEVSYSWIEPDNWESDESPIDDSRVRIGAAAVNPVQMNVGTPYEPYLIWSIDLQDGADLVFVRDNGLQLSGSLLAEQQAGSEILMNDFTTLKLLGVGSFLSNVSLEMLDASIGEPSTLEVNGVIEASDITVGENCAINAGDIEEGVFNSVEGTVHVDSTIRDSEFVLAPGGEVTADSIFGCSFDMGANSYVEATSAIVSDYPWIIDGGTVVAGSLTLNSDWSITDKKDGEEYSVEVITGLSTNVQTGISLGLYEGAKVHFGSDCTFAGSFYDQHPENEVVYGIEANELGGGNPEPGAGETASKMYLGDYTRLRRIGGNLRKDLDLKLACDLDIDSDFYNIFVYKGWNSYGVTITAEAIDNTNWVGEQEIELISPDFTDEFEGDNNAVFLDVPCHGAFRDLTVPDAEGIPANETRFVNEQNNAIIDESPQDWPEDRDEPGPAEAGFFRNVYVGSDRTLGFGEDDGVIYYWGTRTVDVDAVIQLWGEGSAPTVLTTEEEWDTVIVPAVGTNYGDWDGNCVITEDECSALMSIVGSAEDYNPLYDCNCDGWLSHHPDLWMCMDNQVNHQPDCGQGEGGEGGGDSGFYGGSDEGGESEFDYDTWLAETENLAAYLLETWTAEELEPFIASLTDAAEEHAGTEHGDELEVLLCLLQ